MEYFLIQSNKSGESMTLQSELQYIAKSKLNQKYLDKEISKLHKELVTTILKNVNELPINERESINGLIKKCLNDDGKLFLYNINQMVDRAWIHDIDPETKYLAESHHEKLAIKYVKEIVGNSFNCKLLIDNCDCEYLKITLKKK